MSASNSVAWVCQDCGDSTPLARSECAACGSGAVEKEASTSAAEESGESSLGRRLVWYAAGVVGVILLLIAGLGAALLGFLAF